VNEHRDDIEETGLSAEEKEVIFLRNRVRELEAKGLGFAYFRAVNVERAKSFPSAKQGWTPSDWMVALMGEVGELAAVIPDAGGGSAVADNAEMMKRVIAALGAVANTMKKLRRGADYTKGKSQDELRHDLASQFVGFFFWAQRLGETLFGGNIPNVLADRSVLEEGDPAGEVGDVQTYLDLLANSLGVDTGAATIAKFNEVSKRVGSPLVLE
jgi:NTP pyrophosphatase (non-canonical NTP hydrolase)